MCVCVCVCVCQCVCVFVCVCVCTDVCVCVCVFVHRCVCVCCSADPLAAAFDLSAIIASYKIVNLICMLLTSEGVTFYCIQWKISQVVKAHTARVPRAQVQYCLGNEWYFLYAENNWFIMCTCVASIVSMVTMLEGGENVLCNNGVQYGRKSPLQEVAYFNILDRSTLDEAALTYSGSYVHAHA